MRTALLGYRRRSAHVEFIFKSIRPSRFGRFRLIGGAAVHHVDERPWKCTILLLSGSKPIAVVCQDVVGTGDARHRGQAPARAVRTVPIAALDEGGAGRRPWPPRSPRRGRTATLARASCSRVRPCRSAGGRRASRARAPCRGPRAARRARPTGRPARAGHRGGVRDAHAAARALAEQRPSPRRQPCVRMPGQGSSLLAECPGNPRHVGGLSICHHSGVNNLSALNS